MVDFLQFFKKFAVEEKDCKTMTNEDGTVYASRSCVVSREISGVKDEFWIPLYEATQDERSMDALDTILAAARDFENYPGREVDPVIVVPSQSFVLDESQENYIRDYYVNQLGGKKRGKNIVIKINNDNDNLLAPTLFEDNNTCVGGLIVYGESVSIDFID